jgi:DNA-binding response OmpR family regulator
VEQRVLVVDDEESVRDLIVQALEGVGYRVETAVDGAAALEKVRDFQPDLVMLDVIMPKENGYRVSRRIKTGDGVECDPMPKILLVTGRRLDDDPDREDMFMDFSMADGIFYKPFDLHDLLARVDALIGPRPTAS